MAENHNFVRTLKTNFKISLVKISNNEYLIIKLKYRLSANCVFSFCALGSHVVKQYFYCFGVK